jgi:hypothetical protein
MDTMIKHLAPKAKSNSAKKKGRPSARTVLDLDHAFGNKLDNDAGDGAAATEDKNKALDRLEKKYKGKCKSCSKTSPDIWCKINRDSKHAHLTFHQRQAWAVALVCPSGPPASFFLSINFDQMQQNHGVTYDATPNMDLFSRFHFKVPAPGPPATPVSSSVFDLIALAMAESQRTNTAIMASLLAPSCMHPQLPTLQLSPARRQNGGNFYIFMQEIDSLHPMHRFSHFIDTLADKEEHLIVRDLCDLGAEDLISSVHIPSATVNWLISMAHACVNGTSLPQT